MAAVVREAWTARSRAEGCSEREGGRQLRLAGLALHGRRLREGLAAGVQFNLTQRRGSRRDAGAMTVQ